jgi:hypothetical protein
MSVIYDNRGALLPPQVNISERGLIPNDVQTFRYFKISINERYIFNNPNFSIHLPCNGVKNDEILVNIQMNITSDNKSYGDIWLNFKRNKVCLQGELRALIFDRKLKLKHFRHPSAAIAEQFREDCRRLVGNERRFLLRGRRMRSRHDLPRSDCGFSALSQKQEDEESRFVSVSKYLS